jgi:hypothetical protein
MESQANSSETGGQDPGPTEAAADRVLFTLADDHRNSIERDLCGLSGTPTPLQATRISADKLLADEWQSHAEYFATDHAKVPVREYDDKLRPMHTVAVIECLQDHGVELAIWKVEGLDDHDDSVAVVNTARRDGRQADCIVLGRHAPRDQLDHRLEITTPIPGFIGFAIGRSIWWHPLHAHLRHRCTASEARRRITGAYLDFTTYYLNARGGELVGSDPGYR